MCGQPKCPKASRVFRGLRPEPGPCAPKPASWCLFGVYAIENNCRQLQQLATKVLKLSTIELK